MGEQEIQQRILLACGRGTNRLWRNNVGTGWVGPTTRITATNAVTVGQTLRPGDLVIRQARPLHAGLCVGSSDLIGYRRIEIAGQRVAQFVAIEVKAPRGRARQGQGQFLDQIRAAGGCSAIARSVEDALTALQVNTGMQSTNC